MITFLLSLPLSSLFYFLLLPRHLTKTTWFWRRETNTSIHISLPRLIPIPISQTSTTTMSTNWLLHLLASCTSPVPKACTAWLLMCLRLRRWSSETFQAQSKPSMSHCCQKLQTPVCDMMFSLQSARLAFGVQCSYSPLVLLDHSWGLNCFTSSHKLPVKISLTGDNFWALKQTKHPTTAKAAPWNCARNINFRHCLLFSMRFEKGALLLALTAASSSSYHQKELAGNKKKNQNRGGLAMLCSTSGLCKAGLPRL